MRAVHVVAVVACFSLCMAQDARAQTSGSSHARHADTTAALDTAVTALLTNPLGSRSASGTATVIGNAVHIAWSGDVPGSRRIWSVRRGSCTREQGIVGVTSNDAVITVDASGAGRAVVTLNAPLESASPMHVVVHADGAADNAADDAADGAADVALACGALWNGTPMRPDVDHRSHGAPSATPPSVSAGTVDHGAMDHSTIDHAAMRTTGASLHDTGTLDSNLPATVDSAWSALMAIHRRMMADPVIRDRVRTDPLLQRMLEQFSVHDSTSMHKSMPAMSKPGMSSAPATSARRGAKKPATKKPAAKPAPTSMPGMDHSTMPGMNQRQPPVTRKPPV